MATKQYEVTEKAGEWVAGKRVERGQVLTLTDEQAEYEVLRGLLRPARGAKAAAAKAATAAKAKTSKRKR